MSRHLLEGLYGITPEEYNARRVLNYSGPGILDKVTANKYNIGSVSTKTPLPPKKHFQFNEWKTLDAVGLTEDFYSNTVSWSAQEQVSFSLRIEEQGSIYSVNSKKFNKDKESEVSSSESMNGLYAFSITSMPNELIASGWDDHQLRIHSLEQSGQEIPYQYTTTVMDKTICSMTPAGAATIFCGDLGGNLSRIDIRKPRGLTGHVSVSSSQIAGITYDGVYSIATGSNDNLVRIWDIRKFGPEFTPQPIAIYQDHLSCVKAIKFQPGSTRYLISGGGTACRKLCLYDTHAQSVINSVDTHSQITGIHWFSSQPGYFVTSHGYQDCSLKLWELRNKVITQKTNHPVLKITAHERVTSIAGSESTNQIVAGLGASEQAKFFSVSNIRTRNTPISKLNTLPEMLSLPSMTIR
jgi:WD40 repeat protein